MKRIIDVILLTGFLLITIGCSKNSEVCIDCATFSFKQTYLKYFQDQDVFFIKGIALNTSKHGREIKVIEDLKGNFGSKSSIFVWGMSSISFCDDEGRQDMRIDDITQYLNNDTLIIFIEKARKRFSGDIERSGDYATLGEGYSSVIKLSNSYVTGYYINHWGIPVLWEDLQEELHTFLNLDEKPFWWSNEIIPDAFNIAYKGLFQMKEMYNIDDYFFIQGLVLDSYQDYGKRIQLITDFKGNFPEGTITFVVWESKFDNLRLYNHPDTLLMLLRPVSREEEIISKEVKKKGDYTTLINSFSVLKLSNNSVSGYITSCYRGEEVVSWEEFQKLLNSSK